MHGDAAGMDTAGSIAVHGIGFDAEPAARLYDELSRLTVIDAHEHLMPEHERIRRAPDAVLKEAPRAGVDAHP